MANRLGRKKWLDDQPHQGTVMPAYLAAWLSADPEIHVIREAVAHLDR